MKLGYLEKVVVRNSSKFPDHNGKIGVVMGSSSDEGKIHSYAVSFADEVEGYVFPPEELVGTGQFVDRSEFYDDTDRIRVRVEGDEGSIVE
jgi:hypothetical protein